MKNAILEHAQLIATVGMDWLEMEWLYERAKEMHSVVEIGCWVGRSTFVLASACPGVVYAIDHFKGSPEHKEYPGLSSLETQFRINTRMLDNLVTLAMSSEEAYKQNLPAKFDMIFIDGGHEEETFGKDMELWAPRIKRLISGHDRHWKGVSKVLGSYFPEGVVCHGPGSIWYVEVNP